MPTYDSPTETKIATLKTRRRAGYTDEVFQMAKIEWPSPDGSIYYSVIDVDQAASVPSGVSPIDARLIPDGHPDWFLEMQTEASIGDEEIELVMWDADEAISNLLIDHGEGVKVRVYFWFPVVELLLPMWDGHLRFEDEASIDIIKLAVHQGLRSGESTVPGRAHWDYCSAVFGALLLTQGEIDEHNGCPFNFHIGGLIGNNNPATGQPWTFCDRLSTASCTARNVNPNFHLSHATMTRTVVNNQTSGNALYSTSQGNETNLKEPVTVVMGTRRVYNMSPMAFRRDLNTNHPNDGWFFAQYEGCEGPIRSFSQTRVSVGGKTQNVNPVHYNYRLGDTGQTPYPAGNYRLTDHSYSGTAHILYNFGYINPGDVNAEDASASSLIEGLDNVRVYTDSTTYTETFTNNRVWHIARILCDKRWGFGIDYAELDIDSWIDAADWAATTVTYTDPFGTAWTHVRAASEVQLIGRKIQEQIEDMCVAGRLSRPFLFNGKIHIVPLSAATVGELADAPVFTDTGDERNIVWDGGKTTLKVGRNSSYNLTNQIKINFDDIQNEYKQRPLRPVEDIDAQLAAGRVEGKLTRKINAKDHNLLGVVHEAQSVKLAWSIIDLGPCDDGGLQNNCRPTFQTWVIDALGLHPEKIIKIPSSRVTKYGFEYFRVKKIKPMPDLCVEIECQAYNPTYMDDFEAEAVVDPVMVCAIDADCPAGYQCVNGICVLIPPPPICPLRFGTISHDGNLLIMPILECP